VLSRSVVFDWLSATVGPFAPDSLEVPEVLSRSVVFDFVSATVATFGSDSLEAD